MLLWYAEILVQENQLSDAVGGAAYYVNLLRTRAANPDGFVKDPVASGGDAANYQIAVYPSFPTRTTLNALVEWERKLELGMRRPPVVRSQLVGVLQSML